MKSTWKALSDISGPTGAPSMVKVGSSSRGMKKTAVSASIQ